MLGTLVEEGAVLGRQILDDPPERLPHPVRIQAGSRRDLEADQVVKGPGNPEIVNLHVFIGAHDLSLASEPYGALLASG